MIPKTAMVFAAGLGKRLRPLTDTTPKPLLKVAGHTILDRALDRLVAADVVKAVVNTHYLSDQVAAQLAQRDKPEIVVSFEPALLETGGGVRNALPLLGPDPFYVVNGDVVWLDGARDTLIRLARDFDERAMDGLLLVNPVVNAGDYRGPGDFFLDQLGRVRRRRPREVVPFVFTGIQILHPRLFKDSPDGPFSLNLLYDRAIEADRLYAIVHDGEWFHIGSEAGLARAEAELGRKSRRKRP